jgi:hypothetical protein
MLLQEHMLFIADVDDLERCVASMDDSRFLMVSCSNTTLSNDFGPCLKALAHRGGPAGLPGRRDAYRGVVLTGRRAV